MSYLMIDTASPQQTYEKYLFVLGAADIQTAFIARQLQLAEITFCWATYRGVRVQASQAKSADPILYVDRPGAVLVGCVASVLVNEVVLVGTPDVVGGIHTHKSAWQRSLVGQTFDLLGWSPTTAAQEVVDIVAQG